MRLTSDLSARRVFAGAICFLVMMVLPACFGKSDAEVETEVRAETTVLREEVERLTAGIEDTERKIRAACEKLTTNINLLNMLINSPGPTPQQRAQLQTIHDEAVAAKEDLGCP